MMYPAHPRWTVGDLVHDCCARFSEKTALIQAETGRSLTYADLETLTNRIAHGLRERFEGGSDYVGLMLENSPEYLAATYALKKIDKIEVSINRAFRGPALQRMIAMTRLEVLFTSAAHLEALEAVKDDLPDLKTLIMLDGLEEAKAAFSHLQILDFNDILSAENSHMVAQKSDRDVATILFTSGTTGTSKGCLLSHRYAVRTAQNVIPAFRVREEDVVYTPYPLSHIGPAYYDILPTLMTGGTAVMRERFSLSNFWPELHKYGVTWFMCLGSVQQLLWSAEPSELEKGHRVTRCWSTPAPVPKADFDARFDLHLIPGGGFGSTDAGWVVVPQWDHPGGLVLPEFEVRIADDAGDPVPAETPGHMLVRPKEPGIMSDGYFEQPEKTLASWKDLWFHTGDIAKLDEEGRFYFLHRLAERIRVKGEMISAYEVEEGALTHSSIADAAAIGVPSDLGEEEVKLFVVLKPGESLTENQIKQHCAERMAKFMVPAQIVFLDDLPRTPTGKPEKGKLAAL